MKNIPMFTTEYGAASLILKEIPYQQAAYITLQASLEPEKLLEECVGFCRACGAERIYASGHEMLQKYPSYTSMWELRCGVESVPESDAALFPVTEQTLDRWRQIYNDKIRKLPNAAWMSEADGREMLKTGDGYFVHRGGELLGIGRASGDRIDWVASVKPGAGKDVVCALAHALWSDTVCLTVASENQKAVALYESLGFLRTRVLSDWFRVR